MSSFDDHQLERVCGGCEAGMLMLNCVGALHLSGFVPHLTSVSANQTVAGDSGVHSAMSTGKGGRLCCSVPPRWDARANRVFWSTGGERQSAASATYSRSVRAANTTTSTLDALTHPTSTHDIYSAIRHSHEFCYRRLSPMSLSFLVDAR
jgi:hypothetical protein